jgi:hypothetical protein
MKEEQVVFNRILERAGTQGSDTASQHATQSASNKLVSVFSNDEMPN